MPKSFFDENEKFPYVFSLPTPITPKTNLQSNNIRRNQLDVLCNLLPSISHIRSQDPGIEGHDSKASSRLSIQIRFHETSGLLVSVVIDPGGCANKIDKEEE
jgi:hypothetical protein